MRKCSFLTTKVFLTDISLILHPQEVEEGGLEFWSSLSKMNDHYVGQQSWK